MRLALALCAGTAAASQPAGTLDAYAPAQAPEDDLQLSRPSGFGHLRLGAQLHVDYARNPLVWEDALGQSSSEHYVVVRHQLVTTVGVSLGLFDRGLVYAGLPATLWMAGDSAASLAPLSLAAADPAGLGEAYLGGRLKIWGEPDDLFAFAGQLTLHLPSGAYGGQSYRSRDAVSVQPELIGEVRPLPRLRVVANLGSTLHEGDSSGLTNLDYGNELSIGLGGALRAWSAGSGSGTHLDLDLQLHGATQMGHFLDREHSPLEAIAGPKFFHSSGFISALAAGTGLSRGIGSPDVRLVAMLGYAAPAAAPREPAPSP